MRRRAPAAASAERLVTAISLAALLVGCAGSSTPAAHAPRTTPAAASSQPSQPAGTGVSAGAAGADAPYSFFRDPHRDARKHDPLASAPGVTFITGTSNDMPRRRVDPADVSLAKLPMARIPTPLSTRDAPRSMPNDARATRLTVESVQQGWRANQNNGGAAYVKVDAPLGRLQVGNIGFDRSASNRVYRTCGVDRYSRTTLTAARWSLLERDGDGGVVYRVFDGWFDSQTCTGSVVRETVIHPTALVGGLLYAFRSPCDDGEQSEPSTTPQQRSATRTGSKARKTAKAECKGELVTILAPALSNVGTTGMGGEARSSHGAFTVAQLPVRQGGAAAFTGELSSHTLAGWIEALAIDTQVTREELKRSTAVVGIELAHTVSDAQPLAIAYASIVRR